MEISKKVEEISLNNLIEIKTIDKRQTRKCFKNITKKISEELKGNKQKSRWNSKNKSNFTRIFK